MDSKTFHYDGDRVSYVTQSDGKVYRFGYDHSGRPVLMSYQGNQYWYHYDKHGNVIRMTGVDGATVAEYKYDAWGNITSTSGTNPEIANLNPFRYSGYWYDSETKKYNLKARYYDPEIGRFLSGDPVAVSVATPLSLNAYAYGSNNPVAFIDPTGLQNEQSTGGSGGWGPASLGPINRATPARIAGSVEARISTEISGEALALEKAYHRAFVSQGTSKLGQVNSVARNYKLSNERYNNHIVDRHGPNSTAPGKSKFNSNFDIKKGIDETINSPDSIIKPNTHGRSGYIFEKSYPYPIGTDPRGNLLNTMKVVMDEAGNVITAFPIR